MSARCCLLLLAAASLAADDPRKDLQNMQGTWTIESIEKDGKAMDKGDLKNRRVIIQGNRYTVKDGEQVLDAGTYKLDTSKSPRWIDISPSFGPNAGKTLLGIYQLQGDERAICYGNPGGERPKAFTTRPETGQVFIIYKRVKK